MPNHRRSGQGLRRTRRSYNLRSIGRTSPSPTLTSYSRTPATTFFHTWRDFKFGQWQIGSRSSPPSRAASISSARTASLPSLAWSDFSDFTPAFPTPTSGSASRTPSASPDYEPSWSAFSGTPSFASTGPSLGAMSINDMQFGIPMEALVPRVASSPSVSMSRSPFMGGRRRRMAMAGGGGLALIVLLALLIWLLSR